MSRGILNRYSLKLESTDLTQMINWSNKVTAPYREIFISSRLKKGFTLEFSFGSCYRGETRFHDSYSYYWKKVTIYPVSGGVKFYPPSPAQESKFKPYSVRKNRKGTGYGDREENWLRDSLCDLWLYPKRWYTHRI